MSSMQEARERIAAKGGAMAAVDGKFFTDVERRFEGLRNKSTHPADFRRLSADVRGWAAKHASKSDWKADKDQPAYDGALAWIDLIEREIENRVVASEAIGAGARGVSGWVNAETGQAVRIFGQAESVAGERASFGPDYGVGDLVAGLFTPSRREDVRAALQEGTDSAGGYSVPTTVLPQFIDALRAKSVFVQAGARTLMLDRGVTKIVRTATDPTAAWRAESAAITISDPTFSQLVFAPKSLAVLVKASREVLQDSINIGEAVQAAMAGAMSVAMDKGCLFGSGTGSEVLGLFNTSGINAIAMAGANGATPSNYDDLLDMLYELEADNSPEPTAAIWHPRTARTYRKMKDTTGQPLRAPEPLDALAKLSTTSVPIDQTKGTSTNCSTILTGDFTAAILGIREELNIQLLNQTFAATGEFAFVAHMRLDVGFEHAAKFCALTGVRP